MQFREFENWVVHRSLSFRPSVCGFRFSGCSFGFTGRRHILSGQTGEDEKSYPWTSRNNFHRNCIPEWWDRDQGYDEPDHTKESVGDLEVLAVVVGLGAEEESGVGVVLEVAAGREVLAVEER